jgi:hypothetical protein
MAEAQRKDEGEARSVGELTRLIKGELAAAEVVAKVNYSRVGEYLAALKPQVQARKWKGHLREQFDLSPHHAERYIKFHKQTQAYLAGLHAKKPTRLSDVDPPRPDHQPKGFASWRANQQSSTPPRSRWDTESAKADRPRERELGLELIEAGYKLLVQKYHPDKGGDDASFRCLTNARAALRRCLLTV